MTFQEIKEVYKLARTTVVNRCAKIGIVPIELKKEYHNGRPPLGIRKKDVFRILDFEKSVRKNVLRLRDVSKEMGINQNTAIRWCSEIGIVIHKENIGSGKTNLINKNDVEKLKQRQKNKPDVHRNMSNRIKAGNFNHDNGLYHRLCEDYLPLRSYAS